MSALDISESEPLFSCCNCRDDYSWPASDLKVYENELWCDPCWGESDMAADGMHWYDLPAFTPKHDMEIERLTKELEAANANNARLRNACKDVHDAMLLKKPSVILTIQMIDMLHSALAETPAQSVAHYKAQGMLMAAEICRGLNRHQQLVCNAFAEAIEAKAKEMKG